MTAAFKLSPTDRRMYRHGLHYAQLLSGDVTTHAQGLDDEELVDAYVAAEQLYSDVTIAKYQAIGVWPPVTLREDSALIDKTRLDINLAAECSGVTVQSSRSILSEQTLVRYQEFVDLRLRILSVFRRFEARDWIDLVSKLSAKHNIPCGAIMAAGDDFDHCRHAVELAFKFNEPEFVVDIKDRMHFPKMYSPSVPDLMKCLAYVDDLISQDRLRHKKEVNSGKSHYLIVPLITAECACEKVAVEQNISRKVRKDKLDPLIDLVSFVEDGAAKFKPSTAEAISKWFKVGFPQDAYCDDHDREKLYQLFGKYPTAAEVESAFREYENLPKAFSKEYLASEYARLPKDNLGNKIIPIDAFDRNALSERRVLNQFCEMGQYLKPSPILIPPVLVHSPYRKLDSPGSVLRAQVALRRDMLYRTSNTDREKSAMSISFARMLDITLKWYAMQAVQGDIAYKAALRWHPNAKAMQSTNAAKSDQIKIKVSV